MAVRAVFGGMPVKKHRKALIFVLAFLALVGMTFWGANGVMHYLYPLEYEDLVTQYAEEQNLDVSLVYAVIRCESGFEKKAVSDADAKGLMQLTDDTFYWVQSKTKESLPPERLFDPEINIRYGTLLLRLHLDEFQDVSLALAAYHAGRGAVNQWLDDDSGEPIIQYEDTRNYVSKVLETQKIYETLY